MEKNRGNIQRKTPQNKSKHQQQTRPTCDEGFGNRTQPTHIGGRKPVFQISTGPSRCSAIVSIFVLGVSKLNSSVAYWLASLELAKCTNRYSDFHFSVESNPCKLWLRITTFTDWLLEKFSKLNLSEVKPNQIMTYASSPMLCVQWIVLHASLGMA